MVRTRQFVLLQLMYGLTAFAGIMIVGNMARITKVQTGSDLGFLMVAVLAIGNASGRVVTGAVSDRAGTVRTMTAVFALQTAMMSVAGFVSAAWLLAAIALLIGFAYGADLALFPCIVAEYFGQLNQGVNYGLVFIAWGIGGVFGALTAGAIFDRTGSYAAAFGLAAVMCAIATALTFLTRAPTGPSTPPAR